MVTGIVSIWMTIVDKEFFNCHSSVHYKPLFMLCPWLIGPLPIKILFIFPGLDELPPLLFNFL